MKKAIQFLGAILAVIVGLFPITYFIMGPNFNLLNAKDPTLLASLIWNIGFYSHISFSGIALLIGWMLFNKRLRKRKIQWHRRIGKIYVATALLGSLAGIYIGFYSEGGVIASIGFISMGIIWFYTTAKAYLNIKAKNITEHEKMMIYSYAACFAGVTFRLWLPVFNFALEDSDMAYKVVAWWSWVPNLYVAHILVSRKEKSSEL